MKTNKSLFLLIFILISNNFLFSQDALKKGVYNLSGSISYSNSKNSFSDGNDKEFVFSISPSLNYFIIDNLLIGGSISFQYSETEFSFNSSNPYNFTNIHRQYGIGPNIRYYFPGSIVNPFIGVEASYGKVVGSEFETKEFTGMIGINYFLSSNAAVEPYLAYSVVSIDPDQDINQFSIGLRMSYFILNN